MTGPLSATDVTDLLASMDRLITDATALAAFDASQVLTAPNTASRHVREESAAFARGMAEGYRLLTSYVRSVAAYTDEQVEDVEPLWSCAWVNTAGDDGCDQQAQLMDPIGRHWCDEHSPDDVELTIDSYHHLGASA